MNVGIVAVAVQTLRKGLGLLVIHSLCLLTAYIFEFDMIPKHHANPNPLLGPPNEFSDASLLAMLTC